MKDQRLDLLKVFAVEVDFSAVIFSAVNTDGELGMSGSTFVVTSAAFFKSRLTDKLLILECNATVCFLSIQQEI